MHMADALLSPAVGLTMCAVSAGAMIYSAAKIKKDELSEKKLPIMAIAGAFVFAAQMINFTIPGTGSSGHIGGGILLAAMLGGFPAMLTISAVLIIQCLFFADGGLLALGCNIFNMGVIPCLIIYPLIFKPLTKKGFNLKNISIASILSVVVGLQLGSFGVVLETLFSGISELPFNTFLLLMQPIHLAIGLVEGIVTAGILCFVYKSRPEILNSTKARSALNPKTAMKKVIITLSVVTLVVAGGLSVFASVYPDGLEWSMEKTAGTAELQVKGDFFSSVESIQNSTVIMPDYEYAFANESGSATGKTVAGVVGSIMTFALAGATGVIISKVKKRKKEAALK